MKLLLSIVVPVYNEAGNINMLLERTAESLNGITYEVIFVDDSTDETPLVIQEAAERSAAKIYLEHRKNEKGLATAVLKGFELARGDFIAVMDADLQHPPEILKGMYCAMLFNADVCIPSRFVPGASDGGLNTYRKIVSAVARYIGKKMVYNLRHISDPTSGIFMIKREMLEGAKLRPIGWKICVEVMAVCLYSHVIEIPYTFGKRNQGESKLSIKATFGYLKQLIMIFPRVKKNKSMQVEVWTHQQLNEKLKMLQNKKGDVLENT
jgi:dolichol-phosphate mannosyltransferase